MNILFTYLTAFKGHGGIEKFNKALILALENLTIDKHKLSIISSHDTRSDKNYLKNNNIFYSFNGNKINYFFSILKHLKHNDVLILGHINLAIIGYIFKLIYPKKCLLIIVHGIEVWLPLNYIQSRVISKATKILAVSNYTKSQLLKYNHIDENKISVFPNTIDPYFYSPTDFTKNSSLLKRYNIDSKQKIIITVCRISSDEGYKGYDKVIESIPLIENALENFCYLIIGKYDKNEKKRLDSLITSLNIKNKVIFTGYVAEKELIDHFLLGDVFVMPSKNEGFGIVYIEAMACGIPVISGNIDGSVDALKNGTLGSLVAPENLTDITNAIVKALKNTLSNDEKLDLIKNVRASFDFNEYQKRLKYIFETCVE